MAISLEQALSKYDIKGLHDAANIFSMLGDNELQELADDIKLRGLQQDIILSESGLLVDGRNRIMACAMADASIRTRVEPGTDMDMVGLSMALNAKRRHLEIGQRAMAAARAKALYEKYALDARKSNGGDRKSRAYQGDSENVKLSDVCNNDNEALNENNNLVCSKTVGSDGQNSDHPIIQSDISNKRDNSKRAIAMAGAAVGVSRDSVSRAADILEHASPETIKAVENGTLSLNKAMQEVKKTKEAKKDKEEVYEDVTCRIITTDGRVKEIPMPHRTVMNKTNDNVEWARWTWNPITGCLHGCDFCYARAITHNGQMAENYPFGFDPTFYFHRLEAPAYTPVPKSDDPMDKRVFVGSMADIFGKWVPDDWITAIFSAIKRAPHWEYLFLTKWPKRYSLLAELPNCWFGASVIKQVDVARVERDMQSFETQGIKWISLEPMLEPIVFSDLSWCNLVVIGAQTATNQPTGYVPAKPVPFEWIYDVVTQCKASGVPYYIKPNLGLKEPGMALPKLAPNRVCPPLIVPMEVVDIPF